MASNLLLALGRKIYDVGPVLRNDLEIYVISKLTKCHYFINVYYSP